MADLFISYAHEDSAFADRLVRALEGRGREVWIDKTGIEPADKFERSAFEGIQRSDAFVLVLSPASAVSGPCRGEVEHAVEHNKRLIVVCIAEPPEGVGLHPAIAELSWIMMRPADDFESGVDRVIRALEIDLEQVRMHTRILVRAKAWELAERRASPLLRGEELSQAERWLATSSGGPGPEPTDLQREFVIASRRVATRRQRTLVTISTTVAAVSLALAIVALIERSAAVSNQKTANSRQLAASAEANLGSDPELSTLLAMRALSVRDTTQAEASLRDALPKVQVLSRMVPRIPTINVAFSPDGSKFVALFGGGTGEVWSADGKRRLTTFTEPTGGIPVTLTGAAFSPDGQRVVTCNQIGALDSWNPTTGKQTLLFSIPGYTSGKEIRINSVAIAPDGKRLLTADVRGTAQIWTLGGTPLLTLKEPSGASLSFARFSRDGRKILTGSIDGHLRVWDAGSGRPLADLLSPDRAAILGGGFSPDPKFVVGSSSDGTATVWDASSGSRKATLVEPSRAPIVSAEFSPQGDSLATASMDGSSRVWTTAGRQLLSVTEPARAKVVGATFSRDGSTLLTGAYDGAVRLWRVPSGQRLASVLGPNDLMLSATFGPRGQIATAGATGTAHIWDANTGRELAVIGVGDRENVTNVAFSADGRRVATVTQAAGLVNVAEIWDLASGRRVSTLAAPHGADPETVAFSSDGREAVVAGLDGIARVYQSTSGRLIKEVARRSSTNLEGARFGATANEVLTWRGGAISRWDVRSNRLLSTTASPTPGSSSTPDGIHIATVEGDGTVSIFDAERHRRLGRIPLPSAAPPTSFSFNPTGSEVLIASDDQYARLFDTATGRQLASVYDGGGGLIALTQAEFAQLSPDGRRLVTASGRIWDALPREELQPALPAPGHAVASADMTRAIVAGRDRVARVWNLQTRQMIASFAPLGRPELRSVALDARGERALTAGSNGVAQLWDVSRQKQLQEFVEPKGKAITDAIFDPTANAVLTTSDDGTARLWSTADGSQLRVFNPPKLPGGGLPSQPTPLAGAAFSPDGYLFLTITGGGHSGIVEVRATHGSLDYDLYLFNNPVTSASFSPDARRVVVTDADGVGYIFNGIARDISNLQLNYQPAVRLTPHAGPLTTAVFSPGGADVLSTGVDGIARIWDSHTGKQLVAYDVGFGLSAGTYSRDGSRVLLSGGSLGEWSTELATGIEGLMRIARGRVTRELTAAERSQYLSGTG